MVQKKKTTTPSVGSRIKKSRRENKITLENVANETGFAVEHLKAIESGTIIPSVGAVLQISRVLKIDSGVLLRDEAELRIKREKAYQVRTDNYEYETLTPGAQDKHLKAFLVTIDPRQEHKGVGYCHEGEEFVYVLSGQIELMVGDHKNILKENESLHFNSGIRHLIRNPGKTATELLVVISGP